jgi:hypothetical protein
MALPFWIVFQLIVYGGLIGGTTVYVATRQPAVEEETHINTQDTSDRPPTTNGERVPSAQ